MKKTQKLYSAHIDLPIELQHLRVAAYCRVSTEQEEQSSSIELQEQHYAWLISENPNWENAGIFSVRATGLNLKARPEFRKMIKLGPPAQLCGGQTGGDDRQFHCPRDHLPSDRQPVAGGGSKGGPSALFRAAVCLTLLVWHQYPQQGGVDRLPVFC